jgi:hypothetical protein
MFPELLQPGSFGDLKDTDQRPFSEGNATEAARKGEIAQSLGRNGTMVLNGSHIVQVMPNNVSNIFADWIGISICNYSTHALFQCDSWQIKVE